MNQKRYLGQIQLVSRARLYKDLQGDIEVEKKKEYFTFRLGEIYPQWLKERTKTVEVALIRFLKERW